MIIYKNTFENIKTIDCNFPIEDQYYAYDNIAVIADGITRDPIGVKDLSTYTFQDMIKMYPVPSGAEMAAKEVINTFKNNLRKVESLNDLLILANENIRKLNEKYIIECDYLENDFFGAVASAILMENDILHYAYICDCGVIVYDKNKKIKFQTNDDKAEVDSYINKIGIPWYLPEARVIVRRDYRNNLNNIQNDKCVSYGALTGEKVAEHFIKSGVIHLDIDDIIVVYSDGFSNFLTIPYFIDLLFNFSKEQFEEYIKNQSVSDYNLFGKEKTLIVMKR